MAPPRASRRKAVTISSDEDDASEAIPSEPSEDERPTKPQKRSTGKLKSARKSSKTQQPTPTTSTQEKSSQKSPGKAKNNKLKDPPKPNGRPIYSFFNAATDKQRTSQPSASPEKPSTPLEQSEAIQDDIDEEDDSSLRFAQDSSTALAMRKRKVQHGDSFETESGAPTASSQKFLKSGSGHRVPSFSILNEDKRPWTEQFAPNDIFDLAVHKRKISDVQQWVETALAGRRQKVLVLKGAAGTGKTTTVRLLAQHLGLHVLEWKNPAGAELTAEGSASGSVQFAEFVARAGRAGGLTFDIDKDQQTGRTKPNADQKLPEDTDKLLLIEEFPNTFSRTSSTLQSFRSAISQYLSSSPIADMRPTLIVMVVSETLLSTNTALADSFTAHRLLGPDLVNHPYLDTIEFNAVAPTILTKALEAIVVKEARKSGRRKTPGPQVLKRLAESGDIRSAISSLEFLCLRRDDGDTWSSKVAFTKQKKSKTDPALTKAEVEALKLISNRESTLGIFHAVGKVVYNKRISLQSVEHPPPWLPHHRREKVPENDVESLIDELGTDTSTFVAALHENYALSCSGAGSEETMESIAGCMESISDADLLSVDRFSFGTRAFSGSTTDGLRQDEMSFQVATRGLLFSLPYPVHRTMPADGKRGDAHRMFYPSSLRLWRKVEEIEGVLCLLTSRFQAGTIASAANASNEETGPGIRGVEAWKSNTNSTNEQTEAELNDLQPARTNSAKMEMLTERLPYISQIMSSASLPTKLTDQLSTVTRVRASVPIDNDDESDDDEDKVAAPEQWATDRPDADVMTTSKLGKPALKQNHKKTTEGAGLGKVVESSIDKLVLEDDDIVDD